MRVLAVNCDSFWTSSHAQFLLFLCLGFCTYGFMLPLVNGLISQQICLLPGLMV
jgi:hypothetical protein